MYEYPKPFGYADLHAMRDRLIEVSRLCGDAPAIVDRYLTEFVDQIEAEMSRLETVFYQP